MLHFYLFTTLCTNNKSIQLIIKKSLILATLSIYSFKGFSQQTQTNYIDIVSTSKHYNIYNNVYQPATPLYQPDYNSIGNAMAAKQAQYDYYFDILKSELIKQQNLKLINKSNAKILAESQLSVINWTKDNFKRYDITNNHNFSQILNYYTSIYKNENIVNEIKLLKSINRELLRIKSKDPDDFYRSNRYYEIKNALDELAQCEPTKISSIAWKYGFV